MFGEVMKAVIIVCLVIVAVVHPKEAWREDREWKDHVASWLYCGAFVILFMIGISFCVLVGLWLLLMYCGGPGRY